MSHGLPHPGDQGLDRTHRWGPTFWGALCFAFSRIWTFVRAPKIGAILTAGGNGETRWLLAQVLDVADRATGVPVFGELYQTMKDRPVDIDLTGLWSRIGCPPRTNRSASTTCSFEGDPASDHGAAY